MSDPKKPIELSSGIGEFTSDDGMGEIANETMMMTLPNMRVMPELPSANNAASFEPIPKTIKAFVEMDGVRHRLTKPLTILGRVQDAADIAVQDDQVSRHHCAVIHAKGQFFIEDLGSTNGTYVDGQRVTRSALTPGAVVKFGKHSFMLAIE